MKTIQPITSWINGEAVEATLLNAYTINDNLVNSASFYYSLQTITDGYPSTKVAQGNLNMSGEDYLAWQQNSYAWDWVATQLNLVITGEYVYPVVIDTTPQPIPAQEVIIAPIEKTT